MSTISRRSAPPLLALLLLLAPAGAWAQETCAEGRLELDGLAGPYVDFARAAALMAAAPPEPSLFRRSGSDPVIELCAADVPWGRRAEAATTAEGAGPTLHVLPLGTTHRFNSAYPADRNNGAVWAGRGLSSEIAGGVRVRWGALSAQLAPAAIYQQNQPFETYSPDGMSGYSEFIYTGRPRSLDWPQRFGEEPFGSIDPGQSYVRLDAFGVGAGLSTENLWWGSSLEEPLMLSNTAPGFPHLFVGTSRPVGIGIGRLSVEAFWARLSESEYFDRNPTNDHRLFAGFSVEFEPGGVDGLVLGAARTFMAAFAANGPLGYLTEPYKTLASNREADNVLGGIFFNWVMPESGFSIHGELARDDHWADTADLLGEPDHTLAYVLGAQKAKAYGDSWLRVYGEIFRLQIGARSERSGRGRAAFFTHDRIRQGYTHHGHLLGAAVGPGSRGEHLGAQFFTDTGVTGIFGRRTSYDEDAYYDRHVTQGRTDGLDGRDLELTLGVKQLYFLGDFDVRGLLAWSRRTNRSFIGYDGRDGAFPEQNWTLEVGVDWRP